MGISDWSSDVCSSYLLACDARRLHRHDGLFGDDRAVAEGRPLARLAAVDQDDAPAVTQQVESAANADDARPDDDDGVFLVHRHEERSKIRDEIRDRPGLPRRSDWRSEEHTSELQSLMRISYAVFCLKKKINK